MKAQVRLAAKETDFIEIEPEKTESFVQGELELEQDKQQTVEKSSTKQVAGKSTKSLSAPKKSASKTSAASKKQSKSALATLETKTSKIKTTEKIRRNQRAFFKSICYKNKTKDTEKVR